MLMMNPDTIAAKAITPEEQSDSIVVSFGADWHQLLLVKGFSVVIRKRVPKSSSFKWLYFHVNSPISALCGRAEIKEIFNASPTEAVGLAKQIALSPAEITVYIAGDGSIGGYKLGAFEFGTKAVPASELATRMTYHAPQSFFIISKQAKEIVDELAGFAPRKKGSPRNTRK
jgi:predicted transcriptional regulator